MKRVIFGMLLALMSSVAVYGQNAADQTTMATEFVMKLKVSLGQA